MKPAQIKVVLTARKFDQVVFFEKLIPHSLETDFSESISKIQDCLLENSFVTNPSLYGLSPDYEWSLEPMRGA